jgi:hypothetical protein
MIQVPLPYSSCSTIKSVKKNQFLETLYFHLKEKKIIILELLAEAQII